MKSFLMVVEFVYWDDNHNRQISNCQLEFEASDYTAAVAAMPERIYKYLLERWDIYMDVKEMGSCISEISLIEIAHVETYNGHEEIFVECLNGIKERVRRENEERDRIKSEKVRKAEEECEKREYERLKAKYEKE